MTGCRVALPAGGVERVLSGGGRDGTAGCEGGRRQEMVQRFDGERSGEGKDVYPPGSGSSSPRSMKARRCSQLSKQM